jgi:hypothetical protein
LSAANPRELLNKVLELIARDIAQIDKLSGKLDHDVALDLVRYSSALLDAVKRLDSDDDDERKRLSKLSTEELKEKARRVLEGE